VSGSSSDELRDEEARLLLVPALNFAGDDWGELAFDLCPTAVLFWGVARRW
jgi:hypothetical protein